jgi:1-acyl-sn-glycerol-3-phosphate acyltransferase
MLNKLSRFFSFLYFLWAALVFVFSMVLVLPFIILSTFLFSGKKAQDAAFIFIRLWARAFSALSCFFCRTEGRWRLKPSERYIYISNHSSFLDAVMLVRVLPHSFKPLGKAELARTPIFGVIYRKVVIMIDRGSQESRERSVNELKWELFRGQSVLIFPEGTMNRTNAPLKEFYDGAFRIAIETQTALAPVVLINARKLLPREDPYIRMRAGVVRAVFGKPVEVAGLNLEDLPDLKERVYRQMEGMLMGYS